MNNILVSVNFEEHDKSIIDYATQLVAQTDASLVLLYNLGVYPPSTHVSASTGYYSPDAAAVDTKAWVEAAEQKMEAFAKRLPTAVQQRISQKLVKQGMLAAGIEQIVSQFEISQIFMTIQPNEGPLEKLLYQPHQEMIDHSGKPVWLLHPTVTFSPPRSVVFATNFNDADVVLLRALQICLQSFDIHLHIVNISDEPHDKDHQAAADAYRDLLHLSLPYPEQWTFHQMENSKVTGGIMDALDAFDADLLLMVKEDKSFLEALFTTRNTEKVRRKIMEIPLVVCSEEGIETTAE